jgi:hypothetical protein
MVDAAVSNTVDGNIMRVRVPPPAPICFPLLGTIEFMEGSQPIVCVRCDIPLLFAGIRALALWPELGPDSDIVPTSSDMFPFEYCVCPKCGHMEFFAPGVGDRSANPSVPDFAKPPMGLQLMSQAVAGEGGRLEETWMCECGDCNFLRYDRCLSCDRPRPEV